MAGAVEIQHILKIADLKNCYRKPFGGPADTVNDLDPIPYSDLIWGKSIKIPLVISTF